MEEREMTENTPSLVIVGEKLKNAAERASRFNDSNFAQMRPDPEQDNPIDLAEYADACRTLDCAELLPKKLEDMLLQRLDGLASNQVSGKYPSGHKFCLAVFPTSDHGIPFDEESLNEFRHFHQLLLQARGLSYGFGNFPGYYFRLLPKEIQEQCTFEAPKYKFDNFVSPEEKQMLKERILQAFRNLKKLVDHPSPK